MSKPLLDTTIVKKNKIINIEDDNETYYNNTKEPFNYDDDSEYKKDEQNFKCENEILTELSIKIQNNLVNFVSKRNDNSILPLCEFLSTKDVKYFLKRIK